MKAAKRIVLVFLLATMLATSTQAQRFQLSLGYNAAVPLSESFKEYVSKTSFRGMQGAVLYSINDKFRIGLQATYNDFYEKFDRQVYKGSDGSDISTVLSNTLQTTPLLVKGEYSFSKQSRIQPYVGLGAGINFVNFEQYLGEFPYSRYYTKAAFSGDVGVVVPFKTGSAYGFRLSTSYNLQPFDDEGVSNINTWNVQAGVVIPLK